MAKRQNAPLLIPSITLPDLFLSYCTPQAKSRERACSDSAGLARSGGGACRPSASDGASVVYARSGGGVGSRPEPACEEARAS